MYNILRWAVGAMPHCGSKVRAFIWPIASQLPSTSLVTLKYMSSNYTILSITRVTRSRAQTPLCLRQHGTSHFIC